MFAGRCGCCLGVRDGGACGEDASEGVAVTRRMVGMECLVVGVPRSDGELARVVSAVMRGVLMTFSVRL